MAAYNKNFSDHSLSNFEGAVIKAAEFSVTGDVLDEENVVREVGDGLGDEIVGPRDGRGVLGEFNEHAPSPG